MKAIVREVYGPPEVLELRELPDPPTSSAALGADELVVEVHACAVTTADWRLRAADFPPGFSAFARLALGWSRPRDPRTGRNFAGRVLAVGSAVTRFSPGDEVFGAQPGANVERLRLRDTDAVAHMPAGLSFVEAAALPFGGITALHFLRDAAKLERGERVLILGASGGVGVYAVQVAKALGAEVTAVASGANLDFVRGLGADHVIDYRREDALAGAQRYDAIVDIAGVARFATVKDKLTAKGRYVLIEGSLGDMLRSLWTSLLPGPAVIGGVAQDTQAALEDLRREVEAGKLRPVVGSRHAMQDIVAAHRLVDARSGTRGMVVVDFPAAMPERAPLREVG